MHYIKDKSYDQLYSYMYKQYSNYQLMVAYYSKYFSIWYFVVTVVIAVVIS